MAGPRGFRYQRQEGGGIELTCVVVVVVVSTLGASGSSWPALILGRFAFQLLDTKTLDKQTTLLHFLVETIDKGFPELTNFYDELDGITAAARGKPTRTAFNFILRASLLHALAFRAGTRFGII